MPKQLLRTSLLPVLVLVLSAGALLAAPQMASAGSAPAQLGSSYTGTFFNLTVSTGGPLSFTGITETAGGAISGTFAAGGSNSCSSGPFTGTVGPSKVTFTVSTGNGCSDLVFTGKVTALGSKMSGTYDVVVDGTDTQNGTWKVSAP